MVPKRLGAVMLTLGFLWSCTAPQYDDQVDKLITQLQTDVTSEFTTLITQDEKIGDLAGATDKASQAALAKAQAAAGYEANTDAYNKIAIDLVLLKTRISNEPNWGTGHVADALDLLMQQLSGPIGATAPAGTCGGGNPASSMRSVHKACGTLSIDYLVEKYGIISGELNLLVLYDVTIKNGQATGAGSGGGAAPAGAKK
jgi:hypothetical protein